MTSTPQAHPLRRLWNYATAYRIRIIGAAFFSVLNKIFDLAPPLLIGVAVDIVVQKQDSILANFGVETLLGQIYVLAGLTLFIWAGESLFQYIYGVMWRNLAQTVQHDMRLETYDHVQRLEISYFEDQSTGGLMSILNDDINQLERFLDDGANQLLQVFTTVVMVSGLYLIIAPGVTWLAVIPMPVIVWGSMRFQKLLEPRYAAVRDRVGMLNGMLSNNLSGIATIKSYTTETHEVENVRGQSDEYRGANREAIKFSAAFSPLIRMVIVVGFIGMLVMGGQMTLNGDLSVASYTLMIFMIQRLLWPLTSLGQTFDLYQRAMASVNRVLDLLDTESQIVDGGTSLKREDVRGEVHFENIGFEYKDGNQVFEDLTVHVPEGDTVAIVGSTGSGKSTLVKLLLRFYDVDAGAITLDGHDIRDLSLYDLRQAIGFVSQDVYLFDGTVRENITYGTFDATEEQIVEAAKIAEAHQFILELPNGYDTIVGERGQKLSGGQRQRISIARAVLKNPPILILDEATSSVDNETEAAIQRSLERIVVDRTTIVIAHRLSTVRNADKIYVVENGVVHEEGRHDDLVTMDGLYSALWRVQTGERVRL